MAETKTAHARVKAVGPEHNSGLDEGQFRALVSVFGNEDSVGDVVIPGAFTDTLKAWEASGNPIPLVWSHKWDDPFANIGHVVKAEETDEGLEIVGQVDTLDNPTAAQVLRLLKTRRVHQFSFAYDIDEGAFAAKADAQSSDDVVFELRKVALHEIGPCLVGVNQSTELRDVKRENSIRRAQTPAVSAGKTGTNSQASEPRDDEASSNPPRVSPASVVMSGMDTYLLTIE